MPAKGTSKRGTAKTTETKVGAKKVARPMRVNINKASESQLARVPSIGADRAKKIVAYRQKHGDFESVDKLTKVGGFGRKLQDDVKSSLKV